MFTPLNEDQNAKVLDALERAIERGGAAKWAYKHDFSPTFVSLVRNHQRAPSKALVEALGFKVTLTLGD